MSSIEGYGGRAGNHQYAFEHCIQGIRSEDVLRRIAAREADESDEDERETVLAMEYE